MAVDKAYLADDKRYAEQKNDARRPKRYRNQNPTHFPTPRQTSRLKSRLMRINRTAINKIE
jgi:hypothetical protein